MPSWNSLVADQQNLRALGGFEFTRTPARTKLIADGESLACKFIDRRERASGVRPLSSVNVQLGWWTRGDYRIGTLVTRKLVGVHRQPEGCSLEIRDWEHLAAQFCVKGRPLAGKVGTCGPSA